MFPVDVRRWGEQECGAQCERSNLLLGWVRCTGRAEHADHWIPWSRGGATTVHNLVMSCAAHNLHKSNRSPSVWETWWITRRRRTYWVAPFKPGERYLP
ncbi:MAG: HNH endonuclease [Propionibacteriaceae bacterium]|nr:HNH endonuclease [Propionibacteriaceae bacterium]